MKMKNVEYWNMFEICTELVTSGEMKLVLKMKWRYLILRKPKEERMFFLSEKVTNPSRVSLQFRPIAETGIRPSLKLVTFSFEDEEISKFGFRRCRFNEKTK